MSDNQLLETWQIHDRINLYILDAIDAQSLPSYSASKGRSVGEQFAHIHNVRLMWLKSAAPELLEHPKKSVDNYAALKMRTADEVRDRNRSNPLNALVRIEK